MALKPSTPLRIAHFRGDDRQWGRAHGELFREACGEGMPRFYSEFWDRLKTDGPGARRVALTAVESVLVPLFLRKLPPSARDRIGGMAEGTGIGRRQLERAAVLPDLLPWLQAWGVRLSPRRFVEAQPPSFGCSSFLLRRGASVVHGRNLDFPGVNYWDRFPVLEVVDRPGKLKLLNITTAGAPFAVTALNEAGVGISLHQHYGLTTSVSGQLPFVVADEVLGKARSFAEARDLLLGSHVSTSWAFIVYDSRNAAVIEASPKAKGLRVLDGEPLAHTNFFQTPDCKPHEYAASEKMNWDNHCRHDRLLELVRAVEDADLKALAPCLADHFDPYWQEEKVANRTVSQIYNIQSLVVDPDAGRLAVAWGDSPVHLGEFLEYDIGKLFSGRSPEPERRYPAYRFRDSAKAESKRRFVESFVNAMDGKWAEAESSLRQCREAAFFPEAGHVAGVLSLKLGKFDEARDAFESAIHYVDAHRGDRPLPPEYFETALYRARTEDLRGNRAEAKKLYAWVAKHPDIPDGVVKRTAERAGPFRRSHIDAVILPYATYIPFQ